jgi:putative nucleotidyltransferase with HDIG domain
MSFDPKLEEQECLAETFTLAGMRMTPRELVGELVVGAGFVAAAAALWRLQPPGELSLLPAVLCLSIMVLATLVRFDTPFGFTVATQLAFVPLLFALPLALVPVAVVGALAIARFPEVISGKIPPSRLLLVVGNAWFAIGPVAVFLLTDTEPSGADPLLLLAALAAQFTVDFAISSARLWAAREASLTAQLRETWVYAIDAGLSGIALIVAEDIHGDPLAALAVLPLLGLLATFAHERHDRLQSLLELNNAYRGTALVLGDVVEADDGYTGEHCKSVVGLSLGIAEELGLSPERRRNLEFGALLHDVGKIAIPKEIINKPGKLNPEEWTIIKTHTVEGQKLLDRVGGFMRDVGLIVRSHHERWDGSGYPDGLAGEEIPLEARIIACCDTWNAMRTDRSYRKALSHDVALRELRSNSGSQLDPRVVEALIQVDEPSAEPAPKPNSPEPSLQRAPVPLAASSGLDPTFVDTSGRLVS